MPHVHHQTIYRAATPVIANLVHDEEQRKRKAEKKEAQQ